MRRRGRGSQPDGCLVTVGCLMGIIMFLLMEHPVVFWLIFVPIVTIAVIKVIAWLKK